MKIAINTPNDFDSQQDQDAAVLECYPHAESLDEAKSMCSDNNAEEVYEKLAYIAKENGLEYVEETDFGAIWEGGAKNCRKALAALPVWAARYSHIIRPR